MNQYKFNKQSNNKQRNIENLWKCLLYKTIKICINIALAMFVVCESSSAELHPSTFNPGPSGEFDEGFVDAWAYSAHFLLSVNNNISNNYMNSSVVPITYNYGFELGYFNVRKFSEIYQPRSTKIWQYGIMLGTTNFRSCLEEENKNTIFVNDKEKIPYSTTRRFTHNTGFVTLRATTSIQFSFLPLQLLIVPGIKAGYKFSEDYEDYLLSENQKIVEYLPSHATLERNNNITYIVDKQSQAQDFLYGFQFGVAYQWRPRHEDEAILGPYRPHSDIWFGVEYIRANLIGNCVENYFFFGINYRQTI